MKNTDAAGMMPSCRSAARGRGANRSEYISTEFGKRITPDMAGLIGGPLTLMRWPARGQALWEMWYCGTSSLSISYSCGLVMHCTSI